MHRAVLGICMPIYLLVRTFFQVSLCGSGIPLFILLFISLYCRAIILTYCTGASLDSFQFDVIHYIAGVFACKSFIWPNAQYWNGALFSFSKNSSSPPNPHPQSGCTMWGIHRWSIWIVPACATSAIWGTIRVLLLPIILLFCLFLCSDDKHSVCLCLLLWRTHVWPIYILAACVLMTDW